jgi:hypothetical protein
VSGIAAMLMRAEPSLRNPGNVSKIAEFIEATADKIHFTRMKDSEQGHGRVNFWKAVLAVANGGISREGRTIGSNGNDIFFKNLPLIGVNETKWYGFEVRTKIPDAVLWRKDANGNFSKLQAIQDRPSQQQGNSDIVAWLSTQPHRLDVKIPNGLITWVGNLGSLSNVLVKIDQQIKGEDVFKGGLIYVIDAGGNYHVRRVKENSAGTSPILWLEDPVPADAVRFVDLKACGGVLPSLPFTAAELANRGIEQRFLARFSVKSGELTRVSLLAYPPGVTPTAQNPGTPLFELPITDIEDLRKAQNAADPTIRALVEEFDDFVFYVNQP